MPVCFVAAINIRINAYNSTDIYHQVHGVLLLKHQL